MIKAVNPSNPEKSPATPKNKRIGELIEQIDDLKKRWPAHSVPPTMLQRLDELEEELENELRLCAGGG